VAFEWGFRLSAQASGFVFAFDPVSGELENASLTATIKIAKSFSTKMLASVSVVHTLAAQCAPQPA
jgi:hypothetical protein